MGVTPLVMMMRPQELIKRDSYELSTLKANFMPDIIIPYNNYQILVCYVAIDDIMH